MMNPKCAQGIKRSRREVFVGAGLTAGAMAISGSASAQGARTQDRVDVVVIGGGMAGLVAAREIKRAGRSVILVEARDRLGGRTFSIRRNDVVTEYGGMWVHWAQPNVWTEVQRYDLAVEETAGTAAPEHVYYRSRGRTREISFERLLAPLASGFAKVYADARQVFPRPYEPGFAQAEVARRDQMSFAQRLSELNLSSLERDLVSAYFATLGHAHLDRSAYVEAMRGFALCGFSLETLNDAVARYKLKEGTAALVDAIRVDARIDPLLGDPVSSVTQDGSQAIVETEGGNRFHARCVIVTVPLNVLGSVSFTPALNEAKRMHSAERHAGVGVKGYATLRQNVGMVQCFAPDPAPITNAFTERNGPDGSVLVFFGPNRELLDSTNPASVQSALRAFMPGVEVTDLVSHDWNGDPYSLGTWCTYRPGQMTRFFPANRAQEGRLFFASSDTATGWRGFIDGAIERGLRVAVEADRFLERDI
ncbi:MAG: FAD-dependent oxidoreductase [Caulobacteraceae bacterium]|jgi:monoamine oxidase|nr:FAD-dependent oxidoreductase [Caulobacteraceae bacterium]MBP6688480.1 FAD-dependent oxidoreductase [Hyphomonadaceae bacterium]